MAARCLCYPLALKVKRIVYRSRLSETLGKRFGICIVAPCLSMNAQLNWRPAMVGAAA